MEANLDESLWIEIKQKGDSILLCNIYRPPGTPVSFWHRLNVSIEKALDASKRIIIVGDLNENQLNVQNYHVKDILTINNLVNTIEVPTRVTTTSATLLDLIIVPDSEKILDSDVIKINPAVSDHSATYILVDFSYKYEQSFNRKVCIYKHGDYDRLNYLISNTDWNFINEGNVDLACEQFTSKFMELIHECVPNKVVLIRPNDKP